MDLSTNLASKGLLDFHTHSTYSDGEYTPTILVKKAKEKGVTVMALTDHHRIGGLEEFNAACKKEGIFAIPFGVEIHIDLPKKILQKEDDLCIDMIILGKNPKNLEKFFEYQKFSERYIRNKLFPNIFSRLKKEGFSVPKEINKIIKEGNYQDIFAKFIHSKKNVDWLVKYILKTTKKINEEQIRKNPRAFLNKYLLAKGKPAYFKRIENFGIKNAVKLAEDINCKLFIAHPGGEYNCLSDKVLEYLILNGVHGIEVRNYFNTIQQNKKFDKLAKKYNLICSGGSDFHGDKAPFKIGIYDKKNNQLPKSILKDLWKILPE